MPDDRELEQERFTRLRATEDPRLRDALVEDHLWLAQHCARRFAAKGESRDDLEQVAALALVKAVDRFDPQFEVRFTTYAVPTILGELRRHFRDRTWSVRVSRRLKDLHVELRATSDLLSQDLGRRPTIDELADSLGVGVEEVLEAMEAGGAYRATSLSVQDSDGEPLEVEVATDDQRLGDADQRLVLHEALRGLPERDRRVVYLRFYTGLTQAEIATEIGVSQVHVSRILRAALTRLGDDLTPSGAASHDP